MILIGDLDSLAAEYRASWSGLCRGNPRTAYKFGPDGVELRHDFMRWLGRQTNKNKEDNMVLVERYGTSSRMVLVFEGNDEGKTVEQILAETICRLAPNGGPVDSWAIHFSSMHHPFSTTQRLRELKITFIKWWTSDYLDRHRELWAENKELKPFAIKSPHPYDFVKKEFKYYFYPEFVAWLRREYLEVKHG